jgi:hypothetical protein
MQEKRASREEWMVLETVPGNVGDDESSLYQTRTKLWTMRVMT